MSRVVLKYLCYYFTSTEHDSNARNITCVLSRMYGYGHERMNEYTHIVCLAGFVQIGDRARGHLVSDVEKLRGCLLCHSRADVDPFDDRVPHIGQQMPKYATRMCVVNELVRVAKSGQIVVSFFHSLSKYILRLFSLYHFYHFCENLQILFLLCFRISFL